MIFSDQTLALYTAETRKITTWDAGQKKIVFLVYQLSQDSKAFLYWFPYFQYSSLKSSARLGFVDKWLFMIVNIIVLLKNPFPVYINENMFCTLSLGSVETTINFYKIQVKVIIFFQWGPKLGQFSIDVSQQKVHSPCILKLIKLA